MNKRELIIWCRDFDYLFNKVQELGKEWFNNNYIEIIEVITLDRNLSFGIEYLPVGASVNPMSSRRRFIKGDKFFWINVDYNVLQKYYEENLFSFYRQKLFYNNEIDIDKIEIYDLSLFKEKLFGKIKKRKFTGEAFKFTQ